jgi:glycosyltransferase involved in cell wall biosynthesis
LTICAISFKECWVNGDGVWETDGGFPLQMAAVGSLFDQLDLVICGRPARPGGSPLPRDATVTALRNPSGSGFLRKLDFLMHLPYYLRSLSRHVRRADVVHTPLPGDVPLLAMLIAIAHRKPLIARYCNNWRRTPETTFMNVVTRTCMRLFAGQRNVMLATGDEPQPPGKNINWIYATAMRNAEWEEVAPDLDRPLHSPPRLVFMGRLVPAKGVDQLLKAMAILKERNQQPMPHLSIAGEGPERDGLESLARELGLSQEVVFTGQLNRRELSELLLSSDLHVHPSLTESLCKSWLDAMGHGLPVITYQVGAAQAAIGGNGERGWLVPPGDIPGLADAIGQALNGKTNWKAVRRRCRSFTKDRTLEAWARRIAILCAEQWGWTYVDGRLVKT